MRKFFSTILATWILIGILPSNAWAQDANPDSRAQATPDNEDTSSNLVCPDPEAEVVFSEGRARIMEVLKEKNPELYNRLVALWKERNKRLAQLCEHHPELYKRIIALQEHARARREAHQEDRLEHREEKIEARIENETERMAGKKKN